MKVAEEIVVDVLVFVTVIGFESLSKPVSFDFESLTSGLEILTILFESSISCDDNEGRSVCFASLGKPSVKLDF